MASAKPRKADPVHGWTVKMTHDRDGSSWLWTTLFLRRKAAWDHAIREWGFTLRREGVPETRKAQQDWLARHKHLSVVRVTMSEGIQW